MSSAASVLEAAAGLVLLFFLPGFALSQAVFPEWRFRGSMGRLRVLETAAFSLVVSVALTVVVGEILLVGATGFQAGWSDPILEVVLAGISAVGLGIGALRGAFSSEPPAPPPGSEPESTGADPWELLNDLDRLSREERRLQRALRGASRDPAEHDRLQRALDVVRSQRTNLETEREADYVR
ncbi:MAG: hypothetical protein ACREBZ_05160 [Thermoplasmata archaeon]